MPNNIIDLGEVERKSAEDTFWAIRAKAIQSYANLEQALSRLFAGLSETKMDIAGIIFFRIGARARNTILEKLFKKKFMTEFNLFRNSLFDQLGPIDAERNEIVHWNVVNQVGRDEHGVPAANVTLMPPTFWSGDGNTPIKDKNALLEFTAKCNFYARLLNMFCVTTGLIAAATPISEADKGPWLDIFAQRITYPPPSTHPLFPTSPEPDNPAQSFRLS